MTTTSPAPASPLRTILLVIGSVLLVGIVAYLVIGVVGNANRTDASDDVTISESFDEVVVDVEVADVVVEYADVDEATVVFRQNSSNRSFQFSAEVVGSSLEVNLDEHWGGFWMPFGNQTSPRVTVTLPESLEALDLDVESGVGDATLDGDFGEVEFSSGVGDLRLEGSATRAEVETSVGDITARRYSVEGDFVVISSTGDVTLSLDTVPATLDVRSNVGDQDITLPKGRYAVETETGVGEVSVAVDNDRDADTLLRFESSVGDITIRN